VQLYYIHKISVPTCCTAGGLLSQAETCRRTNQQYIKCNNLASNLANVIHLHAKYKMSNLMPFSSVPRQPNDDSLDISRNMLQQNFANYQECL